MSERILIVDAEAAVEPLMQQILRRDIRNQKLTFVYASNGVDAHKGKVMYLLKAN